MPRNRIPKWVISYFLFFLSLLSLFFLLRLIFLFAFRAELDEQARKNLLQSLYIGIKFDVRLAAFASVPFVLYVFIRSFFSKAAIIADRAAALFYAAALFLILLCYSGNFAFYAYHRTAVSAAIFRYLEDAAASLGMVWQTYPVLRLAALFLLLALAFYKLTLRFLKLGKNAPRESGKRKAVFAFLLFVFIFAACYGQINQYPLRWSNAYFSKSEFISNFTLNPVLYIYETGAFTKEIPYDIEAVKRYYPLMAEFLNVDNPNPETLDLKRVREGEDREKNFNVVVIIMESFAWNKSSFGNPELDTTPYARELGETSALFSQFYAPTPHTARAVFASVSSIPDVTSYRSSSRNPFIVKQDILMDQLTNYEKFYFIGGSASWGNIRGVLAHNVEDLKIYEEEDYIPKRVDVWGISDLDLFRESNRILSKTGSPFFAVIQTSGYHRPYTIPKDNAGFILKDLDEKVWADASFNSLEEYNSIRFSDHALGEFMRLAKESSYYGNTIFIVYGDHGLSASNAGAMPAGYQKYNLINNHVPLIIHAPALLKPEVINRTASQVDIMPTAMRLLGAPYTTRAMGRDLFDPYYKDKEGALVLGLHEPPVISMVSGAYFYTDNRGETGLYKFADADNYSYNLKGDNPELFKQMEDTARGIYETSRYMLYNNSLQGGQAPLVYPPK